MSHDFAAFLYFHEIWRFSRRRGLSRMGENDKWRMDGLQTIVKLPILIFCAFKKFLLWTSSLKLTAVSTRRYVFGRDGFLFGVAEKLVKMCIYPDAKGEHGFVWFWPRVCMPLSKHCIRQKKNLTSGKDVNPGGTHYSYCFQSQFWRTCRSPPTTIDLLVLFVVARSLRNENGRDTQFLCGQIAPRKYQ